MTLPSPPPDELARLTDAVRNEAGARLCTWFKVDGTPCPTTDVREGAYLRCLRELTTTSRPRCPCEEVALAVWAEQRDLDAERRAVRASSRDPVATALGLTGGFSLGTLLGGFLLGWDTPAVRFAAFWAAASLVWAVVALAIRARRS